MIRFDAAPAYQDKESGTASPWKIDYIFLYGDQVIEKSEAVGGFGNYISHVNWKVIREDLELYFDSYSPVINISISETEVEFATALDLKFSDIEYQINRTFDKINGMLPAMECWMDHHKSDDITSD